MPDPADVFSFLRDHWTIALEKEVALIKQSAPANLQLMATDVQDEVNLAKKLDSLAAKPERRPTQEETGRANLWLQGKMKDQDNEVTKRDAELTGIKALTAALQATFKEADQALQDFITPRLGLSAEIDKRDKALDALVKRREDLDHRLDDVKKSLAAATSQADKEKYKAKENLIQIESGLLDEEKNALTNERKNLQTQMASTTKAVGTARANRQKAYDALRDHIVKQQEKADVELNIAKKRRSYLEDHKGSLLERHVLWQREQQPPPPPP